MVCLAHVLDPDSNYNIIIESLHLNWLNLSELCLKILSFNDKEVDDATRHPLANTERDPEETQDQTQRATKIQETHTPTDEIAIYKRQEDLR